MTSIFCKAILFDMDGTLLDSNGASEITWTIWSKKNNIDMNKIRAVHHGRKPEETIALVAAHLDAKDESKFIYEYQETLSEGILPIPGISEFYNSIPRNRLGIVTAATPIILKHRLSVVGLKLPEKYITSDLLKKGKPDPEGYLMGARALGVDPKDCVVFEDAPSGLTAAKRAGMKSIAITTNYTADQLKDELKADYEPSTVISNYKNLKIKQSENNLEIFIS